LSQTARTLGSRELDAWRIDLGHASVLTCITPASNPVTMVVGRLNRLSARPSAAKLAKARQAVWGLYDKLGVPRPPVVELALPPRRSSRWLAECAVRVLPAVERARYREEFEAELVELARESLRRQVGHGLRLVVRAVPLRLELRRPAREHVR